MTNLTRVASRLIGCPLLLHPQTAKIVYHAITGRIQSGPFDGTRRRENGLALARKVGSVAEIRVEGELVNKGAWLDADSGLTSYEGLKAQLIEAADDGEVTAIVLDIDSPGGEAGGMWAIADTIRGVSKPVIAVVDDMACSAAYGIASACDEIVISPTSTVGSIGVVLVHMDQSEALAEAGVKPTIIHAGAHKADGNPFGPLSDAVKVDLQGHVLKIYDRFLETVALGRGARLSADQARATEARVFLGEDAIAEGLADRLGNLETVLADLNAGKPVATKSKSKKGGNMPDTNDQNTVSRADHDAAVQAAREEGMAAGAEAENQRVTAILTCDAAKGREVAAAKMACRQDVSAETAIDLLGDLPAAGASTLNPPKIDQRGGQEIGGGDETPKPRSMSDFLKRK